MATLSLGKDYGFLSCRYSGKLLERTPTEALRHFHKRAVECIRQAWDEMQEE